jgi:hypothetical protein
MIVNREGCLHYVITTKMHVCKYLQKGFTTNVQCLQDVFHMSTCRKMRQNASCNIMTYHGNVNKPGSYFVHVTYIICTPTYCQHYYAIVLHKLTLQLSLIFFYQWKFADHVG